jgi:hypothetical protein
LNGGGESDPTEGSGSNREAQMCVNRRIKKMMVLVLGSAAVVAVAQAGTPALASRAGAGPVSVAAGSWGNPGAVPPMLAPLSPSELAAMRRAEAQQWQALSYRLPAGARYSMAEMAVFAAVGYVRS